MSQFPVIVHQEKDKFSMAKVVKYAIDGEKSNDGKNFQNSSLPINISSLYFKVYIILKIKFIGIFINPKTAIDKYLFLSKE